MSNRINKLLERWLETKDSADWVLATIIETDGSSYRKAGAMMMINDLGHYYGLLSGGCLESDIMLQARRCWDSGNNRIVEYDMREEEDLAWQLGIGCGGMVKILLQPVSAANAYLQLDSLHQKMQENDACLYQQVIDQESPQNMVLPCDSKEDLVAPMITNTAMGTVFRQCIKPAPHLAVFGGGVDARPLVAMAAELGWRITLVDPRAGYAREAFFAGADQIIREDLSLLTARPWLQNLDLALIMNHNVKLDAEALSLVQGSSAIYVGMLGPVHRTDRVLDAAGLERKNLAKPLANPVGLRLGGDLPESIALSMLAEAQAFIEGQDGRSISGILPS